MKSNFDVLFKAVKCLVGTQKCSSLIERISAISIVTSSEEHKYLTPEYLGKSKGKMINMEPIRMSGTNKLVWLPIPNMEWFNELFDSLVECKFLTEFNLEYIFSVHNIGWGKLSLKELEDHYYI